eukprot:1160321-Pelagomonas_calceolata.AAC.2
MEHKWGGGQRGQCTRVHRGAHCRLMRMSASGSGMGGAGGMRPIPDECVCSLHKPPGQLQPLDTKGPCTSVNTRPNMNVFAACMSPTAAIPDDWIPAPIDAQICRLCAPYEMNV